MERRVFLVRQCPMVCLSAKWAYNMILSKSVFTCGRIWCSLDKLWSGFLWVSGQPGWQASYINKHRFESQIKTKSLQTGCHYLCSHSHLLFSRRYIFIILNFAIEYFNNHFRMHSPCFPSTNRSVLILFFIGKVATGIHAQTPISLPLQHCTR